MQRSIPDRAEAARVSAPAWARWLTKPLDAKDEAIRFELIEPQRGHKNKTIAASTYLLFIACTFAYYAHVLLGIFFVALTIVTLAWRLRALTNRSGDAYWQQNLLAGLNWSLLIGVVTASCIATGRLSLIALGGPVMAGLANGAALVNAGIPRMAKIQVIAMVVPYTVMAALSGHHGMLVIPLLFPFWIAGIYSAIDDAYRSRAMLIQAKKANEHLAHHDGLTGLPNRAKFMDILAAECRAADDSAGHDRGSYVLYLDLDGFKAINDTLGHGSGDDLLTAVAERFRKHLRSTDTLGRLGGDEFAIILRSVTAAEAHAAGLRLLHAVREPFSLREDRPVSVGVSIGGTRISAPTDVRKTLEAADTMLYAAKRSGRGTIRLL